MKKIKFRLFATLMSFLTAALCGCDSATKQHDQVLEESGNVVHRGMQLPEPWFKLEYPLSEYIEMQPGRPIIVSFGANWGELSQLHWKELFSSEVKSALQSSGVLCLVGDLTEADSALPKSEMNSLERDAVPVTALYDPAIGTWQVKSDIFSGAEIELWVNTLNNNKKNNPDMAPARKPSD